MGRKHGDLEDLFNLSGRVAVVTGGGGVLLGTISKALGRLGVKVAILDLIPKAAQKVESEIVSAGGEAIAVKCNVLDKTSLEARLSDRAETVRSAGYPHQRSRRQQERGHHPFRPFLSSS